ncbi:flippase, partial [Salmonella enterica]|nr:flippase [Salmonella enterica]
MLKNIIYLLAVQGGNYIFPLITLPYLVRVLEPTGYGIYGYSFALIQYFILLVDYGFNYSAPKAISLNRYNNDNISSVFWNIVAIKIIIASIGFIVLSFIFMVNFINYPSSIVFLAYLTVLGNIAYPVWLFQGLEKMAGIAISMLISRIISVFLTFLLVKDVNDLAMAVLIQSSITITAGVISIFFLISLRKINWIMPSFTKMKELIIDGWHYFISSAAISLYTTSATIILGIFTGPATVGYFIAADKIRLALQGIIGPVTQAVFPRVSYIIKDNPENGITIAKKVFKWQFTIMFFLSALLYFLSPYIIHILYGETYHMSLDILKILAFTPAVVTVSNYIAILVMIPSDMKKEFMRIITTSGVVGLICITILTYLYSATGTAVG